MPKYLSYTQVDTLLRCGRVYEFRYVLGIKTPANGNLLRGDAYHKAIAAAYSHVVIYREMPKIEQVEQVYIDTWNKRLSDKLIIDDGSEISVPMIDFGGKDPDKMKDDGIVLLRKYCAEILPKIIPFEVEVKKTFEYNGIPLLSYIDLISWDNIVYDHKLGSRSFSSDEINKNMQSTFYGLVLGYGNNNRKFEFHLHQALSTKEPKINDITIIRTVDDFDWFGELIVRVWKQIQMGIFAPNPTGWGCSSDYCSYWSNCRVPKSF